MKKVLIVCAHRPGRSPSQRYRFEQYLSFLEQNGFQFTYANLLDEKKDKLFYSEGNVAKKALLILDGILTRLINLKDLKKYDIVFIQREASFLGTTFFEKMARRSGVRVIFDFDDSIWLADTSPGNKRFEWLKKPKKFFSNLTNAHTVVAGNSYLAERAYTYNKNTVIIPTTVDTSVHTPKPVLRGRAILTIGWSGSISTLKHFNILLPVLKNIKSRFGRRVRFKIIADKKYDSPLKDAEVVEWNAATEVEDLNTFDIGLMPLPDDEWSKGKCGLKGLTYMACGVATIMSPVGVNTEIIDHGKNGLLAETPDEWLNAISMLIEDQDLRKTLGENGRKTVIEKYSVDANKNKYLEVFNGGQSSR